MYINIDNDNISLRPSWLGVIDWSKGRKINDASTNNYKINIANKDNENKDNDNEIENKDNENKDNENKDNEIENKDNENKDNENIINYKFSYYNEKTEFYKKNAVFLKPQYQNIDIPLEQYLKIINKDKKNNRYDRYDRYDKYINITTENNNNNNNDNDNDNDNDINIFKNKRKTINFSIFSDKYNLLSLSESKRQNKINIANDINKTNDDTKQNLSKDNKNNNKNNNDSDSDSDSDMYDNTYDDSQHNFSKIISKKFIN